MVKFKPHLAASTYVYVKLERLCSTTDDRTFVSHFSVEIDANVARFTTVAISRGKRSTKRNVLFIKEKYRIYGLFCAISGVVFPANCTIVFMSELIFHVCQDSLCKIVAGVYAMAIRQINRQVFLITGNRLLELRSIIPDRCRDNSRKRTFRIWNVPLPA